STGISPHHSGQPTWFETGPHPWEFRMNSLGSPVSWMLAGTCVTATKDSPRVPISGRVPLDKSGAQGCGDFLNDIPYVPVVSDLVGKAAGAADFGCQFVEGFFTRAFTQPQTLPDYLIEGGLSLIFVPFIAAQVNYAKPHARQIPESLKDILIRLIQ